MARCFEIVAMLRNNGNFYETIFLARWSMKLLGLWPEKDLYASIKSFLIFLMSSIVFIPSFLYIKKGESIPVDVILMIVYSVPTITRFLFAKLNSKNYEIIIERMIDDWDDFSDLSEINKKVLLYHAKIARRINLIHTLCIVLTYFIFILTPIYNGHIVNINSYLNITIRKLPFEGWFPFDEKQTPVFEIIYMIQLMQNFFIMCVNFSTDSFLCTAVLHACGQLAILSNVISNYSGNSKHKNNNNNNRECACLSCIVKRHVLIIEYVKIMKHSFRGLILFQLLGNTVALGIDGYLFVVYVENNDIGGIFTYTSYGIFLTHSFFIYCYLGEFLIEKAEDIGNTAYNLKWYKFSIFSSLPLILFIRSSFSCKITAGDFSVMRLSYYQKIIMTSISYISLLKAIK